MAFQKVSLWLSVMANMVMWIDMDTILLMCQNNFKITKIGDIQPILPFIGIVFWKNNVRVSL